MTNTTAPGSTSAAKRKGSALPTWVMSLAVGAVVLVTVACMTLFFGQVTGEEFSPYEFKRRTFYFYEIPGIGIQVWPLRRFDSTGSLETELVTNQLVVVPPNPPERWDLVTGYRGMGAYSEGDANMLCLYFDQAGGAAGGIRYWSDWNKEHPNKAKALWPIIAKLAEQELYFFVPDLFNLARGADKDDDAFKAALHELLARKYHDFGLAQQRAERHEQAIQLLTEALVYAPDRKNEWAPEIEASRRAVKK